MNLFCIIYYMGNISYYTCNACLNLPFGCTGHISSDKWQSIAINREFK